MSMPVLAPLQVTRSRSLTSLPKHIFSRILDELSVNDLCNFAQVSRACNQAIQRDDIWAPRLENMGLWKSNPQSAGIVKSPIPGQDDSFTSIPISSTAISQTTLLDRSSVIQNFQGISLLTPDQTRPQPSQNQEFQNSPLDIIQTIDQTAIPGKARSIFMRIYRCLYPYYHDILQSGTHTEPAIFRVYRDPVDQAKVLSQLKIFAKCDPLEPDHYENLDKLASVYEVFENAALGEFETGFDENDLEGRVKKFAQVLVTLNGGDSCVQLFIQKNQLVYDRVGDAADFLDEETGKLDTKKLQEMLKSTSESINKEAKVIDSIFPPSAMVLSGLCQHIIEENISELFISIITAAKEKEVNNYLEAVPLLYVYFMWFLDSLNPPENAVKDFKKNLKAIFLNVYDIYVDSYLDDECKEFTRYSKGAVLQWKKDAHEADVATETLLLSNVSKDKDKKDILASFKKVLMMPVSVIPFGGNSHSPAVSASESTTSIPGQLKPPTNESTTSLSGQIANAKDVSRSSTPSMLVRNVSASSNTGGKSENNFMQRSSFMPTTLPTTEFDARMALMTSKLEGINTLFSLELALSIIKKGRDAIERAGKFASVGGDLGQEAIDHCETIFVDLVRSIGGVHMRGGFEQALETLDKYDTRSVQKSIAIPDGNGKDVQTHNAVEPLAIFAELVNIGDLIQQMIHVFFEEELIIRGYVDRNSFVSPAVKEKKSFEKMLDSYVANGLSKGIDVLMDQIEYIFMTEQKATDFFPGKQTDTASGGSDSSSGAAGNRGSIIFKSTSDFDMSPTLAAQKVVNLLKVHTRLLVGSTDRTVIDVFQQEVGVRFFSSLCKHIKNQIISVEGSVKLLLDLNCYYDFILSLKQQPMIPYFVALKEIGQMYLIDGKDAKELGKMLSDMTRFGGIFQPEEVFEFAQRREDWLRVRREVEKVMYGFGVADCSIM